MIMSCNKYKNRNYKSALQTYNGASQQILATNIITNPVVLNLGSKITDTGCGFDYCNGSIVNIETSGLFKFESQIEIIATTGGTFTAAMVLDGVVLPETVRMIGVATGGVGQIPLATLRGLKTCCNIDEHNISVIVYSEGTAVGSVNNVAFNAVKLAQKGSDFHAQVGNGESKMLKIRT